MSTSFRAGGVSIDITPPLGGSLAGYFQDRASSTVHDPLHARCLVLESGEVKAAIVTCDLVAVGNDQVSAARHLIHSHTGIPLHHILICATHTHSAATSVPIFQSEPNARYLEWLVTRIADGVRTAMSFLTPARIGWAGAQEPSLVFNRRFFMKPGTVSKNPFGETDQVKMNPGAQNPMILKPAGPTDPELSLLAIQTPEGRPLALLGSYALHYIGNIDDNDISADYFAMWGQEVAKSLDVCCTPGFQERPGFLPILTNGCSGDINNIDVTRPFEQAYPYAHMRDCARTLAEPAAKEWHGIRFNDSAALSVRHAEVELGVRKPSSAEIDRARKILSSAEPILKTPEQVYARETVLLAKYPDKVRLPLQAIRIGDMAIITFPCEAFVEIGLEVKKASPFKQTMCIALANGFFGYIPTPKAHELGGYETWRARSSYLERQAAPKVVETALRLLNEAHGGST